MSTYECKICDFSTDKYYNFTRHTNTPKHKKKCTSVNKSSKIKRGDGIPDNNKNIIGIPKILTDKNTKQYVCKHFGKVYSSKTSKYKHQVKCKGILNSDNFDVAKNKHNLNNLKKDDYDSKDKIIEILTDALKTKETQIDKLINAVTESTKATKVVGERINITFRPR